MGLKRAENQVKILLQETIIALCRNTLNSYGEVCVEGLLGVTLDNEEIFLVSINEMFNNPDVAKKLKKNLKRSKEAGDGSDSETEHSDGDDHGDAPKKRKKKRPRKKKKKGDSATTGSGGSGEESGSSTDQDDNDDNTETEANTTQDDHTNNHTDQMNPPHLNIAPEPSNRSSTADHDHRNTKSEEEDSNDLQKIKIKEELEDEDDDEDLVFVKEEIGDSSFNQNQYSNYSSDGQMYMPPGGMHSGQGGLMQMPGQSNVSGNQYSQDFMGDMSNMSNISQGSDSQMMGFSQGQQNMSFTGASPVAGPSSASGKRAAENSTSKQDGREYICLLCGRGFRQRIHLKTHMRVHTGERPYSCLLCLKAFTQVSNLHRHLRAIHNITENLNNYINSAPGYGTSLGNPSLGSAGLSSGLGAQGLAAGISAALRAGMGGTGLGDISALGVPGPEDGSGLGNELGGNGLGVGDASGLEVPELGAALGAPSSPPASPPASPGVKSDTEAQQNSEPGSP